MLSEQIRQRFLRDPVPTRLGNLASNLARIASSNDDAREHEYVASVLGESKCFAKLAAAEAPPETQAVLAELQATLSVWEHAWLNRTPDQTMRTEARRKSDKLLALAGLASGLECLVAKNRGG